MKKLRSLFALLVLSLLFSLIACLLYGANLTTYCFAIALSLALSGSTYKFLIKPGSSAGFGAKAFHVSVLISLVLGYFLLLRYAPDDTTALIGNIFLDLEAVLLALLLSSVTSFAVWFSGMFQQNKSELEELRSQRPTSQFMGGGSEFDW